jgi:hypothetical protein
MTWTDASIEAMKFGFNAYRDEKGAVRPLVARYTSLPGDWIIEGARITSTERGPHVPPDGFRLVMIVPPPPGPDPLETIAFESLTRPA